MLKIGEFSRRSRLSRKALRLYAQLGLLRPAHVDRSTRYRFYSVDQLRQARLIELLRRLDMPLTVIRQVLRSSSGQALVILDAHWQSVEARVADQRRLVEYAHEFIQGEEPTMAFTITTRRLPEEQVLSVRRHVKIDDLEAFIRTTIGALEARARAQGVEPTGAPSVIYHGEVNQDSDGPVEVIVPVAGTVRPGDGVHVRRTAALDAASTTISLRQAHFPEILQAYDALGEWIKGHGYATAEPPREVYPVPFDGARPDAPFMDIVWPYR